MGKRNERVSKIYRQFTRVKFQKYRLQFPRVRQSELIAKILKEWEAMDENAKDKLQQQYIERSGKNFMQESSSDKKEKKAQPSQPLSSSARQAKSKQIQKNKRPPSPKVRVFKQKSTESKIAPLLDDLNRRQNEDSKSPGKKSTPDKKQSSSSNLAVQGATGKPGAVEPKAKGKTDEYHNFFKYYHDRLTAEHPRWTPGQISTIIKLLWRKRHVKEGKKKKLAPGKALSGRQLYRKTKLSEGFPKQQIKALWRALPHESKKYWQIKGQGKPHRSDKDSGRFVRRILNSGVSAQAQTKQAEATLNWMNSQIK